MLGDDAGEDLLEVGEGSGREHPAMPAATDEASSESGLEQGLWLRVWGLAGRPATARPNAKQIRFYVNGRPVLDRLLSHAVREGYRGLIDPARYPTAVLFLEIDPHEVDVNVHPTKAEVRFRNGGAVHQSVQRAVRAALRAADLVPEASLGSPVPPDWGPAALPQRAAGRTGFGSHAGSGSASGWGYTTGGGPAAPGWASMLPHGDGRRDAAEGGAPRAGTGRAEFPSDGPQDRHGTPPIEAPSFPLSAPLRPVHILQAHRKYVVVEDPEGLLVVDQHALHERLMFERLHARLGQGDIESQRLLVPLSLHVEPSQLETLEELSPLLRRLGFDAAPGGPGTILVHAVPSLLHSRGVDAGRFIAELLDRAGAGDLPPQREAALVDVLSMMACKAAIKAGDSLTPTELADLLAQRQSVERSTACPHGRPTALRITLSELDRWFGRS